MRARCRCARSLLAVAALACGDGDAPPEHAHPGRVAVAARRRRRVGGHRGARATPARPSPARLVTVAGSAYVADAAGTAAHRRAPRRPGALVDVTAPSVLDRQTTVRQRPSRNAGAVAADLGQRHRRDLHRRRSSTRARPRTGRASGRRRAAPARARDSRWWSSCPRRTILDDPSRPTPPTPRPWPRLTAATRGAVTYALARETGRRRAMVFDARLGPDDRRAASASWPLRACACARSEIVGRRDRVLLPDAARSGRRGRPRDGAHLRAAAFQRLARHDVRHPDPRPHADGLRPARPTSCR